MVDIYVHVVTGADPEIQGSIETPYRLYDRGPDIEQLPVMVNPVPEVAA